MGLPTKRSVIRALTLPQFTRWVNTKPADERFNYVHNQRCSIAQFLTHKFPVLQTSNDFGVCTDDLRIGAHADNGLYHVAIPKRIRDALGTMTARDPRASLFRFGDLAAALANA